jgi:photosystem II stability/assembly factor-like uncharacterized protein
LNIAENSGTLWVCGADELIATSDDGGKTWTVKHNLKNGGLLLSIGFANEHFGYAVGTGGVIVVTKDGGKTWDSVKVPSQVVYGAAFADEKHGLIHAPRNIYTTSDGGATWIPVQIDLAREDLKGFSHVLTVVAPTADHMAIVLSQGNSSAHDFRLFVSKDGGAKWSVSEVPSTGLGRLTSHGGEYWFAGMEVIEKDKPGGGYGVPLVMRSADAEKCGLTCPDGQNTSSPSAIPRDACTGMARGCNSPQLTLLAFGPSRRRKLSRQHGQSQKGQSAQWERP